MWGLFEPNNRWLAGGLLILVGLIAQGILLGYLPATLALYWPILLIVAGLVIVW